MKMLTAVLSAQMEIPAAVATILSLQDIPSMWYLLDFLNQL